MTPPQDQHLDAGAYVLGLLEADERARFEDHLATCALCTAEVDELSGLEPLLAEFADATRPAATPPEVGRPQAATVPDPLPRPSEELLDRLVGQVTQARRASRTRRLFLVAAAAVLIVGGPLAGALAAGAGSDHGGTVTAHSTSPAQDLMDHGEPHTATDPATHVVATVALETKKWGTHVALRLGNVSGPLVCDLVAVSRTGERQTVTTWSVPPAGYGIPGSPDALVTHGGSALQRSDIDHFEVRTLDGRQLVAIPV
ncbi:anti-sigma U factor RsuA [Kitasatospora atroaurantiaca]|uniref:Anti-sigma factor RsiW n=1 Tax=Kitasatospora atroaurantiaca TaxID=285545 RepID=A0A561EK03_9ACTN|nr:zf-HC2 domain-containing protein [Kitasatospora atroaurantiaca]TWE15902.1 anti-sigma factor RsiW [Kitasatospora atroaurantiaca]